MDLSLSEKSSVYIKFSIETQIRICYDENSCYRCPAGGCRRREKSTFFLIFQHVKEVIMERMRKYLAECLGTFILVTIGCGTAMTVGCDSNNGSGYILTAFAFGLAIVMMAYSLGNISGGHVNPAVSLAVLINGGITVSDFIGYLIAQCIGAFAGSGLLALIFSLSGKSDMTSAYGSNGLNGVGGDATAGLIVEIILTAIFIITILGVTSPKYKHGSFGGLVIGLTLVGIHILGIGLTGTSVNPARSLGPALISAIKGNADPLGPLWVFIVGPFVGAIIGAGIFRILDGSGDKPEDAKEFKQDKQA